jgi:hypothetical protein
MRKILTYLATDGAFLYEELGAVIVNSEYIEMFGGMGSVTLRSDPIDIKLDLDRDIIFPDVRAVGRKEWFSLDIISELLTGVVSNSADMESNEQFFRENFSRLKSKFSALEVDATERHCKKLKQNRLNRRFPKR